MPQQIRVVSALLAALLLTATVALADPVPTQGAHHVAPSPDHAARFDEYVPGANRLEGRIRAPCCWNQTLDIHGSEVSQALRREIRERLRGGETPDAIEASIVGRYGERVLAVPPGSPLKKVAVVLSVLLLAGGAGAATLLLRWRRRSRRSQSESANSKSRASAQDEAKSDALEERLDAELRALGD